MANFSKKSNHSLISKSKIKLFGIWASIIALLITLTLGMLISSLKYSLSKSTPDIIQQLNKNSNYKISLSRIDFNLTGNLRLIDVRLADNTVDIVKITSLKLRISLLALLKKELKISKITASGTEIPLSVLLNKEALIENLKKLTQGFLYLKGYEDMRLNFSSFLVEAPALKINLDNKDVHNGFITCDAQFSRKANNIILKSSLDLSKIDMSTDIIKQSIINNIPKKMHFYVNALMFNDNLMINNAKLIAGDLKLIGSGIIYHAIDDPYMDIKIISNPFNLAEVLEFKSQYYLDGLFNITSKLYGNPRSPKLETEMTLLNTKLFFLKNILRIGNVSCNLILGKDGINIKDFTALIDNRFPFFLSGNIKNILATEFDINVSSSIKNQPFLDPKDRFDFYINLSLRKRIESLSGNANISFLKEGMDKKRYCSRQLQTQFDNLSLIPETKNIGENKNNTNILKISAKRLNVTEKIFTEKETTTKENFEFSDFSGSLIIDPGFWTIKDLSCDGYSGKIKAYVNLDFTKEPYQYKAYLLLDHVDIVRLKRFYPIDCNLFGIMSGRLALQNDPSDYLEGAIKVSDAVLENLEPLNQAADFLGINSIKHIERATIISEFKLSKTDIQLNRLNLNAPGIILKTNFVIKKDNWLDGNISLSLAREFLEESKQFKALLNIVQEKGAMIDFDFKVAGFQNKLRIQLLEGDFRNKIISRLSKDIQGRIESEINKILESPSSQ